LALLESHDDLRTLSCSVLNFAPPALIFKALGERSFSDIAHPDSLIAFTVV